MASLYLSPDLAFAPHERGDLVELHGPEARHAAAVSRVRVGETLRVGDGQGLVVTGIVVVSRNDLVQVVVEQVHAEEAPTVELWLAQALAKGDRDELAVQAATELGVSGVMPWSAERSVSVWNGPKAERGVVRWRTIVAEATKQSIRSRVPVVTEPVTTSGIAALAADYQIVVLDPDAQAPLSTLELDLGGTPAEPRRVLLVVGPEGGISPREIAQLTEAGARSARLGSEVLRTSTAGPAAIAVLNVRLGRW